MDRPENHRYLHGGHGIARGLHRAVRHRTKRDRKHPDKLDAQIGRADGDDVRLQSQKTQNSIGKDHADSGQDH